MLGCLLYKQAIHFLCLDWQLGFKHTPDKALIDLCLAVNKDVTEGDNAAIFADPAGGLGIQPGEPGERLTDDFELALDG